MKVFSILLLSAIFARAYAFEFSVREALDELCTYYSERVASETTERSAQLQSLSQSEDTLEAVRLKLELKRLDAEREVLSLLCTDAKPQRTLDDQDVETRLLQAWQADCHADGKHLAIIENNDKTPELEAFYRERVAACIASGRAAGASRRQD